VDEAAGVQRRKAGGGVGEDRQGVVRRQPGPVRQPVAQRAVRAELHDEEGLNAGDRERRRES
jgi:hypothetical protein